MSNWRKIGDDGTEITMLTDKQDRFVGLIERHRVPIEVTSLGAEDPEYVDGPECSGAVLFDLPWNNTEENAGRPKWAVESWEPLTISPSILCRACGHHGWIREGRWVSDLSAPRSLPIAEAEVKLIIGGEAPVFIGSYQTDLNSHDLTADRRQLATLLRAYADKLDNGS